MSRAIRELAEHWPIIVGLVALGVWAGALQSQVAGTTRDVQTLQTQASVVQMQAETIKGLARYACRQNVADAVLAGLSCDALLRDRP